MKKVYDVIVVGGGHAGCEAAMAASRMGSSVLLISMDMNKFAQMSCNPAIGGIAKGQIVREIDALGGYTGIVTDASTLQFRMLNRSKGPAMWSPRAQCDREKFIWAWREVLDNIPNASPRLRKIANKCIDPDPKRRYSSFSELYLAIERRSSSQLYVWLIAFICAMVGLLVWLTLGN